MSRLSLPSTLAALALTASALPASAIILDPETEHPEASTLPKLSECQEVSIPDFYPFGLSGFSFNNNWYPVAASNQVTGLKSYILPQGDALELDTCGTTVPGALWSRSLPGSSWQYSHFRPMFGQNGILQEGYASQDESLPANNFHKLLLNGNLIKDLVFTVSQAGPVSMDMTFTGTDAPAYLGYIYYNRQALKHPDGSDMTPSERLAYIAARPTYYFAVLDATVMTNLITVLKPDGTPAHPAQTPGTHPENSKELASMYTNSPVTYPGYAPNIVTGRRLFLVNYDDPENPSYTFPAGTEIILVYNTQDPSGQGMFPTQFYTSSATLNAYYGDKLGEWTNTREYTDFKQAQGPDGSLRFGTAADVTGSFTGWNQETGRNETVEHTWDEPVFGQVHWVAYKQSYRDPVTGETGSKLFVGFEDRADADMNDIMFGLRGVDGTLAGGETLPEPQKTELRLTAFEDAHAQFGQHYGDENPAPGLNCYRNNMKVRQPQDDALKFRSSDLACGLNFFTIRRAPSSRAALAASGIPTHLPDNAEEVGQFVVLKTYKTKDNTGNYITEATTIQVPVVERDSKGLPISGADGNPIYVQDTDADGNLLVDDQGNPVYKMETQTFTEDMLDAGAAVPGGSEVELYWLFQPYDADEPNNGYTLQPGIFEQIRAQALAAGERFSYNDFKDMVPTFDAPGHSIAYESGEWDDSVLDFSSMTFTDQFDGPAATAQDAYLYQMNYQSAMRDLYSTVDFIAVPAAQLHTEWAGSPLSRLQSLPAGARSSHGHYISVLTEGSPVLKSYDGGTRYVIASYTIKDAATYAANHNAGVPGAGDDDRLAVLDITAVPEADQPTLSYSLSYNKDSRFEIVNFYAASDTEHAHPLNAVSAGAGSPLSPTVTLPAGEDAYWIVLRDNKQYYDADNTPVPAATNDLTPTNAFQGYYAVANVLELKPAQTGADGTVITPASQYTNHYGSLVHNQDLSSALTVTPSELESAGVKHLADGESAEGNYKNLRYKYSAELSLAAIEGLDPDADILYDGWSRIDMPVQTAWEKRLEADTHLFASQPDFTDVWTGSEAPFAKADDGMSATHRDFLIETLPQYSEKNLATTYEVSYRAYVPLRPVVLDGYTIAAGTSSASAAPRRADAAADPARYVMLGAASQNTGTHMLTGIEAPDGDPAEPRYFNLQGLPIPAPVPGEPCIRVLGTQAAKYLAR